MCFHDNDLIPFDATPSEHREIQARFKRALDETGLRVTMATTNLAYHPAFKDGAFTANDPAVRRFAIAKAMRAIDLGAELGAEIYVFWGGREGSETHASKPAQDALERYREAIDFLCGYVKDRGYPMRFALEPKPNEPRGDLFLPTVGHALHFISRLERPARWSASTPRSPTRRWPACRSCTRSARRCGRESCSTSTSTRSGSAATTRTSGSGRRTSRRPSSSSGLLEQAGYDGPAALRRAPAAQPRTPEGVWDFARGCMRTYLILAEKARAFDADPRVQEALAVAGVPGLALDTTGPYTSAKAELLLAEAFDADALAARRVGNELLDQLAIDHLLGAA